MTARDIGARLPASAVMLTLGGIVQLFLAFAFRGGGVDVQNFEFVGYVLAHDPLHIYAVNNEGVSGAAYPPGFFGWLLAAHHLAAWTGLPFHGLLNLPLIAATLLLAVLVRRVLIEAGRPEPEARLGLACVALGPLFLQISGWHGQLDALAFLPAFWAVVLWSRNHPQRALYAGLLIGAGAAVKTVPILLLAALWPSARSLREAATVTAWAAAVPALLLVPFYLAEPVGTLEMLRYAGLPGAGGLSLLVQPQLAEPWVWAAPLETVARSDLQDALQDAARFILGGALLAAVAILARRRADALTAAIAILLVVYAASPNVFAYYLLWIVPFLLASGRFAAAVGVQLAAVLAQVLIHFGEDLHALVVPYVVLMIAVTLTCAAAAVILLSRIRTDRPAPP